MNKIIFPFILFFLLLLTFLSCSNEPKRSRKPVSNITISPSKNTYSYGDYVTVHVNTSVRNGEIAYVQLFYQNQLIHKTGNTEFTIDSIKVDKLGNNIFSVTAVKTDSVKNVNVKTINVLSDTEPEKLTYKTVNTYPHNNDFFTQGLEYYNGYIYEGTGENGASALYKLNLETGNILQSHKLADKYFGEGITILNDKVYQITYKAQKGFVYNLSDFAVIDSFRYDSQQGWGLTNDGTNLIMSNGTHILTWIDPDDYTIVKTLQVANNRGIINNLNELEYVNGFIYANVYTTDIIVQIDAATGKVLAEINLGGILNMYKKPGDQIDYLNGIAWDKETKRMFVTGKWWPRLFEIKLVPQNSVGELP